MSNKVTIEEVHAAIKGETYTVLPDGRTTICQLTLDNGFTVDGKSACVSVENFNAELGQKYSKEKALDEVWKLLGFRLAEQLMQEGESSENTFKSRLKKEYEELSTRVDSLRKFLSNEPAYIQLRRDVDPVQQKLLTEQLTHMRNYQAVLKSRLDHLEFTRIMNQATR